VDAGDVELLLDDATQLGVQHRQRLTHCILLQELLEACVVLVCGGGGGVSALR
jgi:hypothetical protein